jgi:hypothetical protein
MCKNGVAPMELDEQIISVVAHGADGRTVDERQAHAAILHNELNAR